MVINRPSSTSIAIFFSIVSILITGIFIFVMIKDGYIIGTPISMADTGQVGDFIGGVVGTVISAAAFYFLYMTFSDQRKTSYRQHVESYFYEMLRAYQTNVNSMKYDATNLLVDKGSLYIAPRIYESKEIFDVIFMQLVTCRNELKHLLCKHSRLYISEYENHLLENNQITKRNIDIYELGYIDIAYNIVFYGTSSEGMVVLRNQLYKRYKKRLVDIILKYISLKPASNKYLFKKWNYISSRKRRQQIIDLVEDVYEWRQKKIIKDYQPKYPQYSVGYNNDFVKYYKGFQHIMGHYYRQLFHMVTYINEQKHFDYQTKYDYVKNIRTLMSNSEQVLLFFNSISCLGRQWELEAELNPKLKEYCLSDYHLITKYDLIKNIPDEMLYGVNYKSYYPFVNYEHESIKHANLLYN